MEQTNIKNGQEKVSNVHQVGGIEMSILDNGAGRGLRIAWFNTGSGLRFQVILDRGMDIGAAFYNAYSLTWISHQGPTFIEPSLKHQNELWLNQFGGGLLTTCGLSHIGNTEIEQEQIRPLNGTIHAQSAEIIEIQQPNLRTGEMDMKIVGILKESNPFGVQLVLKRTIRATLGKSEIHIQDEIINEGNTSTHYMLLYHNNFGWPLVDSDTKLYWDGPAYSRGTINDDKLLQSDYKKVKSPIPSKDAEACIFIDALANEQDQCSCGLINPNIGLQVEIQFNKQQLPWLTNWQHWETNHYVVGLEPGTNPPIGQAKAKASNTLKYIQPNASIWVDLRFVISKIDEFNM